MRVIGTRHGEKLYETLLSREEMAAAEDLGAITAFRPICATSTMASTWKRASQDISVAQDYNSHNTTRLDVEGMERLLHKLSFVQALARGETVTPEE